MKSKCEGDAAHYSSAKERPERYRRFRERLLQMKAHASNIGWGYCDSVREHVQMLETTLGNEEETDPQEMPPNTPP